MYKSLKTLQDGHWLDDEVITVTLGLIMVDSAHPPASTRTLPSTWHVHMTAVRRRPRARNHSQAHGTNAHAHPEGRTRARHRAQARSARGTGRQVWCLHSLQTEVVVQAYARGEALPSRKRQGILKSFNCLWPADQRSAVNPADYDLVLLPLHLGVHWALLAVDLGTWVATYWDSMHAPSAPPPGQVPHLIQWLRDVITQHGTDPQGKEGIMAKVRDDPPRVVVAPGTQQGNGFDC